MHTQTSKLALVAATTDQVEGSLSAGGARTVHAAGRWAEAVLEVPDGVRATLHLNPDGSGHVLLHVGDRVVQQLTWEARLSQLGGRSA